MSDEVAKLRRQLAIANARADLWRSLTCRYTDHDTFERLRQGILDEPKMPLCQLDKTINDELDALLKLGAMPDETSEEMAERMRVFIASTGPS